jgi:predicted transcriptional regulator
MTREQIDAIFERAREWPLERQEEAAEMLLILEDRAKGVYRLSDEERADIREALAEMERGEVASDEEVAALFDRLRQR